MRLNHFPGSRIGGTFFLSKWGYIDKYWDWHWLGYWLNAQAMYSS